MPEPAPKQDTALMDTQSLKLRWLETDEDADLKRWLDAELAELAQGILALPPINRRIATADSSRRTTSR